MVELRAVQLSEPLNIHAGIDNTTYPFVSRVLVFMMALKIRAQALIRSTSLPAQLFLFFHLFVGTFNGTRLYRQPVLLGRLLGVASVLLTGEPCNDMLYILTMVRYKPNTTVQNW